MARPVTGQAEAVESALQGAAKAWIRILRQTHPGLHFEAVIEPVNDDQGGED